MINSVTGYLRQECGRTTFVRQTFANDTDSVTRPGQAAVQGVGASLKSVGESISSAGRTLTTDVTLPLAGIGFAATKAASDFQASMEQLVTQAGLPADQLQKLTGQVLAFAQSGAKQTPEVLAQGLYHIVSLGVATPAPRGRLSVTGSNTSAATPTFVAADSTDKPRHT